MTREKPVHSTIAIFRMPLLIGIISIVGLASALLGDAMWDVLSWITLAVPVAVGVFFWARRAH